MASPVLTVRTPLCFGLLVLILGTHQAEATPSHTAASLAAGGDTTLTGTPGRHPFSQPAANLDLQTRMSFVLGEAIFNKIWVPSPSSTTASDGLGPLYNARSCGQCHVNDGRGNPITGSGVNALSSLLRLSVPAHSADQHARARTDGLVGDPNYGTQLQPFSVAGVPAEGRVEVDYTTQQVSLADGTQVELRAPVVRVIQPGYGDFDPALRTSFRIAPPMIGLGLLERIPQADLEQQADPEDRDGDGISGRINRVYDHHNNSFTAGRFGWKAGQPTLAQQNASALANDIGIGNPTYASAFGNCTARQTACLNRPDGNTAQQGGFEASEEMMSVLAFYTGHIAVPAARDRNDPQVKLGRELFSRAGCAACHSPVQRTGDSPDWPALAHQQFQPYTDLLLHDMGPGLADRHQEFEAQGSEWRTAPLWGLGLTRQVSDNGYFLHDGRARTLLEAILWHGGEAEASRNNIINMSQKDRNALIRFLESL
ncbi:putative thiol oxidoreductase [Marinobacterium lacunae]|uniref:Putative thiol oxidoreductase n=1 Tax=Marinobacterium lacunae TaxID=1232683 RepID=A0A081FVB3_9GAMM|nr:di-heme oxidoredictase family protein [Marinobacterium lacunae]KEA62468.1 putative thiol oxidoreductase [Marinobacterium lacunae]